MPSVTPEHRRERRHRRERSSSNDSNSSGSNRSVKRSSEQSSSGRKKSKDDKHQRNSSHRSKSDKRPKRVEHVDDNHQKQRRSHRSRSRSKSRERQSNRSSHSGSASRQKTTERDKEKPRLDPSRVVIKQEPLSDDEDRRRHAAPRRDAERARVKVESDQSGASGNRSEVGDKTNIKEEAKPKEKPNFQVSGKLAEDTNVFNGVVVKYNEPPEAKKPSKRWRLYAFKGEEALPMLPIHRQSAYLLGRDRKVADIPIDHPSCSKQHAVLQFRAVTYTRDDGTTGRRIRPYVIDLESANGTFVNNQKIDPKRYVELFEKDVVKFGFSSREYVLLHEGSTSDDIQDDDVKVEEEDKDKETEAKEGDAETSPK